MSFKKTATFDTQKGVGRFTHTPHHEEMLDDATSTNDAPNAVEQNLADITCMSLAFEAIETIVYRPIS